jgi:hypothetical protein
LQMEARLPYLCISFGWLQDLLEEEKAPDLFAAVRAMYAMLDRGGMIVHVYRETDQEHPELVGRHRKLGSLGGVADEISPNRGEHEVERFLLDAGSFRAWADALQRDAALERFWRVVDLWPLEEGESDCLYGRATLIAATFDSAAASSRYGAGPARQFALRES